MNINDLNDMIDLQHLDLKHLKDDYGMTLGNIVDFLLAGESLYDIMARCAQLQMLKQPAEPLFTCPGCGYQTEEEFEVCPQCGEFNSQGQRLVRCAGCGHVDVEEFDECPQCGQFNSRGQELVHCPGCGHVYVRDEHVECPECHQYDRDGQVIKVFTCPGCGYEDREPFDLCPQCHEYDSLGRQYVQCPGCDHRYLVEENAECPQCHRFDNMGEPIPLFTCVGCGYQSREEFEECPQCHDYDSAGNKIVHLEFRCVGCGYEAEEAFDECPECHHYNSDGEEIYVHVDEEGRVVAVAERFEEQLQLKKGFSKYYHGLREKGMSDDDIYNLFVTRQLFLTKTTLYDVSTYFKIGLMVLIDELNSGREIEYFLIDKNDINKMRKVVQIGIEKEDPANEFFLALYIFFIHGYRNGYFKIVSNFELDFETNENVWAFFDKKKIQNYMNLNETRMEQNMLWSNMNQVLKIRDRFTKITKNCIDYKDAK